jgi:hypothetical protein
VTNDDDQDFLHEILKDPTTARLLFAWRRSVREVAQAEEAARAVGVVPPDWDVGYEAQNDDE